MDLRGTRYEGSGEDYITRSFMLCTPHKYYSSNKIKNNELRELCGRCGRQKCVQGFGGETEEKRPLGRPKRR